MTDITLKTIHAHGQVQKQVQKHKQERKEQEQQQAPEDKLEQIEVCKQLSSRMSSKEIKFMNDHYRPKCDAINRPPTNEQFTFFSMKQIQYITRNI